MPILGDTVAVYQNQPAVSIRVHGHAAIRFVIDTGFTDMLLSVPVYVALGVGRDISEDRLRIKVRRIQPTTGVEETTRVPLGDCKVDIDWFGTRQEIQATICKTAYGLLGVGLLHDCKLEVDWPHKAVRIDRAPPGTGVGPATAVRTTS